MDAGVRVFMIFEGRQDIIRVARICLIMMLLVFFQKDAHAYTGEKYKELCGKFLTEIAGDLGSLFAAIAGVGAIIASAMGGMKMAWSLVVVSIGSYILQTYQELWFDSCL